MKVLVTGGSGFIGVHLVDLLRNQKYTVLNLDISKPINNTNIDLWRNVSVTDKELLAKQILEFDPNYIIHLSATTTQNAISLEDFTVNIQGTQNLIEVANNLTSLKNPIELGSMLEFEKEMISISDVNPQEIYSSILIATLVTPPGRSASKLNVTRAIFNLSTYPLNAFPKHDMHNIKNQIQLLCFF